MHRSGDKSRQACAHISAVVYVAVMSGSTFSRPILLILNLSSAEPEGIQNNVVYLDILMKNESIFIVITLPW